MKVLNKAQTLQVRTSVKQYILLQGMSDWSNEDWAFFTSKVDVSLALKTGRVIVLEDAQKKEKPLTAKEKKELERQKKEAEELAKKEEEERLKREAEGSTGSGETS